MNINDRVVQGKKYCDEEFMSTVVPSEGVGQAGDLDEQWVKWEEKIAPF